VICQRKSSDNNVATKKCGLFNIVKGSFIVEILLMNR